MIETTGGTMNAELRRTAELVVETAKNQGVYFAVALLYDASYDHATIGRLLPFLQESPGSILPERLTIIR